MSSTRLRVLWIALLILALGVSLAPQNVAAATAGQGNGLLQDCSQVDEQVLQDELNTVAQQVFAEALAELDMDVIVARQWTTLEMDQALNDAVDTGVARVRSETDLWNTFVSSWSPDKARELTLAVANYTFASPTFRAKMDALAVAISTDVGDELARASADSTSAALYCLQSFIGANYAKALVRAFEDRVQDATATAQLAGAEELAPNLLAMIGQHQVAIGGVGVIIATQLTRKIVTSIARRISQRIAGGIIGRVLGRVGTTIIPLAGWIVGTGMIAYDLYTSLDGALPQIQESLKSPPVKESIRGEIAAAIRPELETEIPGLARTIANDLYAEWRAVKRSLRQLLDLAAADPDFANLLSGLTTQDELARVATLVDILLAGGGEPALKAAVADGTLRRVLVLPESAVAIVRDTGSLETALAWSEAVGSRLSDVVALELYKQHDPSSIDLRQLDRLLALEDKTAVARIALLPPEEVAELLKLPAPIVRELANLLAPDQLGWLARLLPALTPEQRNQLVARVLSQPAVIEPLAASGAEEALAQSRDLDSAITFLMGSRNLLSYLADMGALASGSASWALFYARYGLWSLVGPVVVISIILGPLVPLLKGLVLRLIGLVLLPFRRRKRRSQRRDEE
ncbi:MAG: hypothetical protein H3C34_10415 [Caldilineaceae bacterium]|nr:hypothetical protein [Caldilineaceae bacterium]